MYIIIGGDQKEYGPITADDVRQWIAEGRLNEKTLMKTEGDAEFRPLEKFPEFAAAFAPKTSVRGMTPAFAGLTGWSERDYDLDIVGCVSRGWGLVKKNFGLLFVSLLVLCLLGFVIFSVLGLVVSVIVPKHLLAIAPFKVIFNYLLSGVSAFVMGPLAGGVYLVFLKAIRGQPVSVGDVFSGFQKMFLPLLFLGYLAVVLATGLCMLPLNYFSA